MSEPLVTIVIPTVGRADALRRCLESVRATVVSAHEIVCVTVADDRPTQTLLADAGGIRNMILPARSGFVHAANTGFRAAHGTYLTQLNDDCTLLPHTIDNAIRFLEAPAHGFVGLAALFHDTPVRRNVFTQIDVEGTRYVVCHVRGLCYANFGVGRRDLYERLDYFDERYHTYGADPDFSLKVWHEARLSVVPCPGGLVHHEQLEDDRAVAARAAQADDNARLFAKWRLAPVLETQR